MNTKIAVAGAVGGGRVVKHLQKLFISNLPWTVGNQELKQYFSKFGHVSSANIIFDKMTGMSRGYGFIAFSSREGYNSAINKNLHNLEGRNLSVKPATS